jgi:hypothetical protein
MWCTAGEDVNFQIEFLVDGEYVIPTSATGTVHNDSGQQIASLKNVPLAVTTTTAILTIPAAENTVEGEANFENRYISLSFVSDGKTYTRTLYYQLAPFLPLTVTPDDARRELGLETSEAPDSDIDIRGAYILLREEYGVNIENALTGGTGKTLAVNQAVAVKAALELVGGLQFRAAVKMKAEDSAIERMAKFDVDIIRIRLGQRLSKFLSVVNGETEAGNSTLILSNPTDAITGA